uniref:Uncharacterized protein n=1 Tax=Aegilops tauschii TaxID=37682 RepID=M8AY12_AEGTA
MAELDARRTEVRNTAARGVQSQLRTHVAREQFLILRNASVCLQSFVRARLACKLHGFLRQQAAVLKIQKNIRRYFARRTYSQLCLSAITLQTGLRTMAARNEFNSRNQDKASIHIQAARDTQALKVAKEKLEERVEELMSRLSLEKKLRTDLEKSKATEISKLQSALHDMEQRVEEAAAMKENESAKKAVEEALAQEREKISSLTSEIEGLKVLLVAEREENDVTKKAHANSQERNEELNRKVQDADEMIKQLNDIVKRLEETVREGEALLLTEKQQKEEASAALAESHLRDQAFAIKIEEAEKQITLLQENVERFEYSMADLQSSLTIEKQQHEASVVELAEAQVFDRDIQIIGISSFHVYRLEERLTENDALSTTERQENEATKKLLNEVQGKNEELLKKLEDAGKNIVHYQDTTQRLEENVAAVEVSLKDERQQNDVIMKQLADAQRCCADSGSWEHKEQFLRLGRPWRSSPSVSSTGVAKRARGRGDTSGVHEPSQDFVAWENGVTDEESPYTDFTKYFQVQGPTPYNHALLVGYEVLPAAWSKKLDEESTARDALLVAEKQEKEVTKKTLTEALDRIEELVKELECANNSMHQLQDSIQRLEQSASAREAVLLTEHQEKDAKSKALAEAEARIDGLLEEISSANINIDLLQKTMKRLEEGATTTDALYLEEKHAHDQTKKVFSEAQEVNQELLRKVEEADKNIGHLLENVERLEKDAMTRESLLLKTKQSYDDTITELFEAQETNQQLTSKIEDSDNKIGLLEVSVKRFNLFAFKYILEESTSVMDSQLAIERHENSKLRSELSDARLRIDELLNEAQDNHASLAERDDMIKRLEENVSTKETLLLTEREQNASTSKLLAEEQLKIAELIKNIEEAHRKSDSLQTTIERLEEDGTAKDVLLLTEKQAHEATRKTLVEAQERNEELLKKIHDDDKNILQLQFTIQRLEENTATKENLLLREREQNDATTKSQIESQERSEELLKKFVDVDRKIDLLQDSIERLGESSTTKDALLLSERQEKDAMKKELAEAGEKNGELLMKIEDTNEKIEHLQNTIIKLEEDIAAKDVSLEAARQENDSIRKSLTEAQERNEELLRKISDNEYRIHLLQDTVQKIQVDAISRLSSFVMEKQDSDVAKRALTEAQERNEDLLKRNEDLLNRNNDLVKKIEESGKVITHLQESLQRIEGKAANLEADNHVLRQQAAATPPSTAKSPPSRSKITRIHRSPENGHVLNGELRQAEMRPSAGMPEATPPIGNAPNSSNQKDFEHGEKLQRVLNQKHQPQQPQDDQQWLLTCIPQYLGFSGSKPVATLLIYQCLLHWRSFEAMKTGVFDRILHAINSAIEAEHDVRTLAYWLSNLSALTVLLQRSFKTTRTALSTPQRRRFSSERTFHTSQTSNAGLAYLGGQSVVGATGLPQVEAKYPALLFKQQLVDLIEKVYGMISDSVKKELNPLLELCIQDPRTSHSNLAKSNTNGLGQQNQLAHWLNIVKVLANYLDVLKANHVPSILVHKLFVQIFSLIDVQLFNRLLLRRECCSFSNGEYVKAGLAELKHWSDNATREFAGSAWEALKHIRQAVDFLVISLKPMRTLREIRADVCQALSIQQLERIVGMYLDDVNGSNTISAEFASSLKAAAREEANTVTTFSILLDDDSSIPFSLDDITKTMPIIEMADDDLLRFVRENPGFAFLLQRGE